MAREIGNEEFVTQYGNLLTDPVFRSRPHADGPVQNAMSVTLGRLEASEMAVLVRRAPDFRSDAARHAHVGSLRRAGFVVRHQPSVQNPDHAVVEWPGEWDGTVETRFSACFGGSDG